MKRFVFHDECGAAPILAFLNGWLDEGAAVLERLVGGERPERIHVFLSPRQAHEDRFPPEEGEELLNDHGEAGSSPVVENYRTYAHGVVTLTSARLGLPAGVPEDEPAFFLDLDTLSDISNSYGLTYEAVVGRTALHELSHIAGGHVSVARHRTHGFVREGDAQRDAWAALAELVTNPRWSQVAEPPRQVRRLSSLRLQRSLGLGGERSEPARPRRA